jgi:hypothetical protein
VVVLPIIINELPVHIFLQLQELNFPQHATESEGAISVSCTSCLNPGGGVCHGSTHFNKVHVKHITRTCSVSSSLCSTSRSNVRLVTSTPRSQPYWNPTSQPYHRRCSETKCPEPSGVPTDSHTYSPLPLKKFSCLIQFPPQYVSHSESLGSVRFWIWQIPLCFQKKLKQKKKFETEKILGTKGWWTSHNFKSFEGPVLNSV